MRRIALTTIVLVAFILVLNAWSFNAQSLDAWSQGQTVYQNSVDNELTIRTISLLPVFDNLQGIYAKPIQKDIANFLKNSHRFNYIESNYAGPLNSPDDLEQNPATVTKIFANESADSLLSVGIAKGPAGIDVKMDLFLKSDQKLLVQQLNFGIQTFAIASLKPQIKKMLDRLFEKVPYSGLILSRQGTRVTVNLGHSDGVKRGQILTVIQIIKIKRHPKFGFIVSSVKNIIGQVKVLKAFDTLSFGRVIDETEPGVITVNSKIAPVSEIVYPENDSLSNLPTPVGNLLSEPGASATYGKNPTAWIPTRQPSFGMVGVRFGVGSYTEHVSQTPPLNDSASIYPSIFLEGALWLTPAWTAHLHIWQGIISTKNPVSDGSPSSLSHRLSLYDFLFGYNIRLAQAIEAPRLEFLFGYSTYDMDVDQSSPTGLTSKTYSGPEVGFSGWYPLAPKSPYGIGANFYYMFSPHLHESPFSSGSSTNRATQFGIFLDKQIRINLKARFELDFDSFSSDFSSGVTSSQEHDVFSGGLYYLF